MVALGSVEEALEAIRAGRPVLVADSPDRENEADVVFAASNVSVEWVAWTIRHSSGYLCAPMPGVRADALDLPLMVPNSQDPRRTAYTVTVDAATGVTTGISASDRARTLRVLADPASGSVDLIRPGHVLPLRAVPGGVLHRAGHTEAAVDLVRLAGVGEVGGIAELVRDDGSMMRLGDAAALAQRDGLVLITIEDLIAWRRVHDPVVVEPEVRPRGARVQATSVAELPTAHGAFRVHGYRDLRTGAEHVALVPRDVPVGGPGGGPGGAPLVRVHSECLTGDAFGSLRCDCGPQLQAAMARVAAQGGAVVYLRGHEGRGIGLLAKVEAYALQDAGLDTVQANLELGWPVDRREYGAAAAILADLGLERVTLLTNNPAKVTGLAASGIDVVDAARLEVGHGVHNHAYLVTKKTEMGHLLDTVVVASAGGESAGDDEEVGR
ncbi:3,4-dihydroxy 2-butanone 4-phosphate synthase/GTP cyclohydrolase II [Sediminihabitans luteus]|uniref:GTP cyclohydrolase-2 n=1 Tax=Sediminihabitans luteus TaxID=1138585 RepID=A0A2M9CQM6_9CELL|nr:3,4-dihydroxy-2-butanone-4-phosphate synthase [Sediminihabitans luteus]PJJ74226.1 3,4-dihydroxy 2-butanone 4-phosphate synthase/GTP cyclohydrolase II [Sediminihabitans luteus]GII99079.1 GTP cyclohydrolase-2 [Sediminihabitans luteus]